MDNRRKMHKFNCENIVKVDNKETIISTKPGKCAVIDMCVRGCH